MIDREDSAAWAETALRYLDALDAGDLDTLTTLWQQAAADPEVERILGELTDGVAAEEGMSPAWEADAERIRGLLREHLPSGFGPPAELPPLTVGEVAACLQRDSALGARLREADQAINRRLLIDATPIPDELGLPHFEKWKTSLGVSASPQYWRAFRQAAVLLLMGQCQRAGELAAARRAGKGGRP